MVTPVIAKVTGPLLPQITHHIAEVVLTQAEATQTTTTQAPTLQGWGTGPAKKQPAGQLAALVLLHPQLFVAVQDQVEEVLVLELLQPQQLPPTPIQPG